MASMYEVTSDQFTQSAIMDQRAIAAINRTWEAIGSDYLELGDSNSISRKEMLEAVMDADRLDTYGSDLEAAQYVIWMSRHAKTYWQAFQTTHLHRRYGY